jgi:predicted DNA-binding protein (MmcQ/YjbR family)
VNREELRARCLGFPGAWEDFPFGEKTSVFKVKAKIFALSQLGSRPLKVSLKCEPEIAADLRETYPAVAPGYHLNKRHWNTITLDGSLSEATIGTLLEDSYDLVIAGLTKREREQLGRT